MVSVGSDGVNAVSLSSFLASHRAGRAKIVDTTLISSSSSVNGKIPFPGSTGARLGDIGTAAAGGRLGSGGATFPQATAGSLGEVAPEPESSSILPPSSSAVPRRWGLLHRIQRLCRPADLDKRGPAVCGCGRPGYEAEQVNIHLRFGKDGVARAGVSGVYSCGSPWLCPTCAPARAHVRAERVQRAADATYRRGGAVALVVLTASHSLATPLADIKKLVSGSSRKARQGRAWQDLVDQHGILGVVVGQEVTVSLVNGWHYHQHLSVLLDGRESETAAATEVRAQAAGDAVAARYKAAIRAAGGSVSDKHGCRVRVADDAEDASRYTSKGSSAWEVAGGHKDETKAKGSLTPWDLAESAYRVLKDGPDASTEARWARARWAEYVEVMPGTRSCVISASLAKTLGIEAADDAETGEQVLHEADEVVGRVPVSAWRIWMRFGLVASFLARVEISGEAGFDASVTETESIAAAIGRRSARAQADIDMLTPDAPLHRAPPPDPEQVAAQHAHLRSVLIPDAAVRISEGAGTVSAIRRTIDAFAAANPILEPLSPAEVVAAMARAA